MSVTLTDMNDKPGKFASFLAQDAAYRERKKAEWKALQGMNNAAFGLILRAEEEAERKRVAALTPDERKAELAAAEERQKQDDPLERYKARLQEESKRQLVRSKAIISASEETAGLNADDRPGERFLTKPVSLTPNARKRGMSL